MLIYDGTCEFCTRWVNRIRESAGPEIKLVPSQEVADQFPQISSEEFERAVQWIEPDGSVLSGARAVFRLLSLVGFFGKVCWWCYRSLPFFALTSESAYRQIAKHRSIFSRVTRWLWGDNLQLPIYRISARIFLRSLGGVYFIGFSSLWFQVEGLIGSNGILPVQETMEQITSQSGSFGILNFPTLFWFSGSDFFLKAICLTGILLSLLSIFFPAYWLFWPIQWGCYLSFVTVGRDFLSFQWDALLLEVGFLAIFTAPLAFKFSGKWIPAPSRLLSFLFRWLLFRFMFASGVVKLSSQDPTWWDLTALTYHYFTQPLPNSVSWYFHQLPESIHIFSCACMFLIEIGVPFLLFTPRRTRTLAFGLLILFQLVIALTGNYTFFNLLTVLLCLWLIDDQTWSQRVHIHQPQGTKAWSGMILGPFLALTLLLSTFFLTRFSLRLDTPWPEPVYAIYRAISPFRILNTYGLFQVMTTDRPEIVLEGSDDGINWKAYEFNYKPGELSRHPPFVAPHQPRLDWQMWFAALRTARQSPWFLQFCSKIANGNQPVLDLLSHNPFPERPPRFFRALLYDYQFTSISEKSDHGNWWKRELLGEYLPVVRRPLGNQQ